MCKIINKKGSTIILNKLYVKKFRKNKDSKK